MLDRMRQQKDQGNTSVKQHDMHSTLSPKMENLTVRVRRKHSDTPDTPQPSGVASEIVFRPRRNFFAEVKWHLPDLLTCDLTYHQTATATNCLSSKHKENNDIAKRDMYIYIYVYISTQASGN